MRAGIEVGLASAASMMRRPLQDQLPKAKVAPNADVASYRVCLLSCHFAALMGQLRLL